MSNFLDRLAFNRLVQIITNFIIAILKMFVPKDKIDDIIPTPPIRKRRWFPPWKKLENDNE